MIRIQRLSSHARYPWFAVFAVLLMGGLIACLRSASTATVVAERQASAMRAMRVDVAPVGWRRTVDGWELAESWGTPSQAASRDINQWIAFQRMQEASYAQTILEHLRYTHPLIVSTTLLLVVVSIAMIHERRKRVRLAQGDALLN